MEQQQEQSLFDLQLDNMSQSYLMETSKWGKFLAIMGFIGCGLLIIIGIFSASVFSRFNSLSSEMGGSTSPFSPVVLSLVYVIMAVLYFFPCYYLFNFSSRMQTALRTNDQQALQSAFASQKACYKFVGILTIVVLSLYVIALIAGMIFAASLLR